MSSTSTPTQAPVPFPSLQYGGIEPIQEQADIKPRLPSLSPSRGRSQRSLPSPASPLREVSPEQAAPPPHERKPGEPRFPPRTEDGDRQCTNCGEIDTPQWRGTLCNACALWKRSRGTDRPLPLLFPPRRRAPSPSPSLSPSPLHDLQLPLSAMSGRFATPYKGGTYRGRPGRPDSRCELCHSSSIAGVLGGRVLCGRCLEGVRFQENERQRMMVCRGFTWHSFESSTPPRQLILWLIIIRFAQSFPPMLSSRPLPFSPSWTETLASPSHLIHVLSLSDDASSSCVRVMSL
jgi:hypothetical protein